MKLADPKVTTVRPWTAQNRAKNGKSGTSSRKGKTKKNLSDLRPKTTENRKKDSILKLLANGRQNESSDSPEDSRRTSELAGDSRRTSDLLEDREQLWQPWSVTEPAEDDYGKTALKANYYWVFELLSI